MENASLLSTIIAASGGAFTAVVSIFISSAIAKTKRAKDIEAETASKRIEGGWAGLVDDWREWSSYVEGELRRCRENEAELKLQCQQCYNEIQKLKSERGV